MWTRVVQPRWRLRRVDPPPKGEQFPFLFEVAGGGPEILFFLFFFLHSEDIKRF
jgi:hypothetical protein